MKARYAYRVYLQSRQSINAAKQFGCNRVVWNDALAWVMQSYDVKQPSNAELQALCVSLAKQYPERAWLSEVSAVPLQQSIRDLGVAFKNYFESLSGVRKGKKVRYPKFKKRNDKQTARYNNNAFKFKGEKLYLAGIGWIKVKWSRELPSDPSSVTLIKNKAGQYHVSFVVEVSQKDVDPVRKSAGVDLGIKVFGFTSYGEKIISPDYKPLVRKLKRFQRKLARQVKGSNRWNQTKQRIAKLHLKIANIRKDFLHKTTTKLVRENQTLSLEDLNVSGMMKNRKLARAIAQQGWATARTMCEAKAKQIKDRTINIISRWEPTSQTCSSCGYRWGKVDLSIRSIVCLNCHTHHDRDENAAKNIDLVGVGHSRNAQSSDCTHDSKRTMKACKTGYSGGATASSNHTIGYV